LGFIGFSSKRVCTQFFQVFLGKQTDRNFNPPDD
jgi:hypothetical protein